MSFPARHKASGPSSPGHHNAAFTLIELLVVIMIIALLIGILLPSLSSARQAGQLVVNQANQRQLTTGQLTFSFSNDDEYATLNSGIQGELQFVFRTQGPAAARALMEGNTAPTTPTSLLDWVSPTLGEELGLSPNRAERTYQIFSEFGDPRAKRVNDLLYGTSGDYDDFDEIQQQRGYPQMSYLAPATFHYGGYGRGPASRGGGIRLGTGPDGPVFGTNGYDEPFNVPDSFKPRLDRIGQPSGKIMLADGTRYWNGNVLDFDVNATPILYGSFTSQTPIRRDSTAYKRPGYLIPDLQIPSLYQNNEHWKFSVRYMNHTRLTAAFFDGHVEAIPVDEAYGKVDMWAPAGTEITEIDELTDEAIRYIENATGAEPSESNPYKIN